MSRPPERCAFLFAPAGTAVAPVAARPVVAVTAPATTIAVAIMVAAFSGLALRAVVPFARFGVYRRQRDLPERLVDLLNLNLDRVADVVLAFDLFYALPETELRGVHETVLRG